VVHPSSVRESPAASDGVETARARAPALSSSQPQGGGTSPRTSARAAPWPHAGRSAPPRCHHRRRQTPAIAPRPPQREAPPARGAVAQACRVPAGAVRMTALIFLTNVRFDFFGHRDVRTEGREQSARQGHECEGRQQLPARCCRASRTSTPSRSTCSSRCRTRSRSRGRPGLRRRSRLRTRTPDSTSSSGARLGAWRAHAWWYGLAGGAGMRGLTAVVQVRADLGRGAAECGQPVEQGFGEREPRVRPSTG
jgi:hypothetical protein